MASTVLIIASPAFAGRILRDGLSGGLNFIFAATAAEGLQAAARHDVDAIIVDLTVSERPLHELCASLRNSPQGDLAGNKPLIAVAADATAQAVQRALDAGADDCVPASISERELIARLRAWLRRYSMQGGSSANQQLRIGPLHIDIARHRATVGDRPVQLTPREFDLLVALARRAGMVVQRKELLAEVWGGEFRRRSRTLDVHIGRLRRKLEQDPHHPCLIVTVPGIGYLMQVPEESAA